MNSKKCFRRRCRPQFAMLCWLLVLAAGSNSPGQGLVNFNNRVTSASPPVDAKIYYDFVGGLALSGTDLNFRAALLGGPTTATATTVLSVGSLSMLASPSSGATWVTLRTGAAAGYVAVGTDSLRDSGLPFGTPGLFQVVAWRGTETTWAVAYSDWKAGLIDAGFSNPLILQVSTNSSSSTAPNLVGLQSFSIHVPEPSTYCFGILGVVFFFICRLDSVPPQKSGC